MEAEDRLYAALMLQAETIERILKILNSVLERLEEVESVVLSNRRKDSMV